MGRKRSVNPPRAFRQKRAAGPVRHLVLTATVFLGASFAPSWFAATPKTQETPNPDPTYLTPIELHFSRDGQRLYVVAEGNDSVLAVETRTGRVAAQVKVGRKPKGIALSPDSKSLYVANEWSDTISEIDAASFQVRRTLQGGWGPTALTTDKSGKFLYVANAASHSVSLIDLHDGRELKRFAARRSPQHMRLSRDGRRVYVSNVLPLLRPYDEPPVSEVTVIDAEKQVMAERIQIPGVIELRHIAEAPAALGGYLIVPMLRPKNLGPLIRVEQGWVVTHGMAVIRPGRDPRDEEGRSKVTQVLLDDIDQYYADGFGAAFTPDGRWALVTAAGANRVSILDTTKLAATLRRKPAAELANRLDAAREFVVRRLPTQDDPRAVAVAPGGRFAYVANRLADSLTVVDLTQLKVSGTIDLGGPKEISVRRRGQQLFHNASYCLQSQFSCASCHPEEHLDGLAWNLETPQLGRDRVANRTLRGIAETAPYKWNGRNPDLITQCGPRIAKFLFRSEGFNTEELLPLVTFLRSIPLPPNRHRSPDGELTEQQERGRAIYYRTHTNEGKEIPIENRCDTCHPADTHYTNRISANVGSATEYDTITHFDTPQLDNVADLAPYLHNGMALTLEEIWTVYNNNDTHGVTSDMRKEQLTDLIEFLKTL
jgi:YVTN family beta-propeller protein